MFPNAQITRRGLLLGGAVCAGAFALSTAGCATDSSGSDESSGGSAVLRFATGFAIENLIPSKTGYWGNEFGYAELLLRPQPDGNPTGWLLEDVTNSDELTWALKLKEGICFQNGTALDAERLATLMNWHLANTSAVSALLPGAGVEASGDHSLTMHTTAPTPQLRNILADEAYFTIFDLDAYQTCDDDAAKILEARIYTGPYVPVSLDDQKLTMEVNSSYWNGTPGLAGVEVHFVSDASARIKAVQNGEVDIALYPPTQQAQSLEGDPSAKYQLGEASGPSFCLYMNENKPVFADARVRKALLRMVNYEALARDVMQGFYEPVSSMYDPKLPYAIDIWRTDIPEAESLLGQAGANKQNGAWTLADGSPLNFEILTYPQQPDSDTLALAIQSQMKDQGITVTIRQVSDVSSQMETDDWQAGLSSNGTVSFGGSPIPPLQNYYRSGGKRNYSHINDSELDSMIDQLSVTLDEDEANRLLESIQQRIGDQGYNGFCGRRRPSVVVGSRMPDYTPQHALIWVDASTQMEA